MNIKPTTKLMVKDWKENVVNLVQYPRARCCVNLSPFSLKVETFLRLFNIEYRNVDNQFKHGSSKGLVPFIEFNGRQIPDSNNIMEFLKKELHLPIDNITSKEASDAHAYTIMLEQSFFPGIMYMRSLDPKWMFSEDKGAAGNLTGAKKAFVQNILPMMFKSGIKKRLHSHGIGRDSKTEVEEKMKRDLSALSNLLGDKDYFFGKTPGSFDATAFAHLCMLYSCPQPTDTVLNFVDSSCTNLRQFYERVKGSAFPDWHHLCSTLELNKPTAEQVAAENDKILAQENFAKSELQV